MTDLKRMQSLHWLLVSFPVKLKALVLAHKALNAIRHSYLQDGHQQLSACIV